MTWIMPVAQFSKVPDAVPASSAGAVEPTQKSRKALPDQDISRPLRFSDLLDIVNPLQHIPIISTVYRAVTGDHISDGARHVGHALYGVALGGPVGMSAMLGYSIGTKIIQDAPQRAVDVAADALPAENDGLADAGPLDLTAPVEENAPVPLAKPELASKLGEARPLLGADIGRTGEIAANRPVDLAVLLAGIPSDSTSNQGTPVEEAAGRKPHIVTAEERVEEIASHSANHLPLEVLKVLQERHATRTSSEQS